MRTKRRSYRKGTSKGKMRGGAYESFDDLLKKPPVSPVPNYQVFSRGELMAIGEGRKFLDNQVEMQKQTRCDEIDMQINGLKEEIQKQTYEIGKEIETLKQEKKTLQCKGKGFFGFGGKRNRTRMKRSKTISNIYF